LRPAASTAGNGDDRIARLRVLPAARDAALFGRIETARQLDRTPAPGNAASSIGAAPTAGRHLAEEAAKMPLNAGKTAISA
jgi:hypothetical protein